MECVSDIIIETNPFFHSSIIKKTGRNKCMIMNDQENQTHQSMRMPTVPKQPEKE